VVKSDHEKEISRGRPETKGRGAKICKKKTPSWKGGGTSEENTILIGKEELEFKKRPFIGGALFRERGGLNVEWSEWKRGLRNQFRGGDRKTGRGEGRAVQKKGKGRFARIISPFAGSWGAHGRKKKGGDRKGNRALQWCPEKEGREGKKLQAVQSPRPQRKEKQFEFRMGERRRFPEAEKVYQKK